MYEKGYTSLGEKTKTFPHYDLFDARASIFKHARELTEISQEREGRIKTPLPMCFSGKVIHGKGLGKQLGFPTANLDCSIDLTPGVYSGECQINKGSVEKMVMSVGTSPMFGDNTVEVHIINQGLEDFYGETLYVKVTHFIRKMRNFPSKEILIENIQKDISVANFHSN